ncbi:MAG: TonB-dependent receptor domain-containing protein, partial [Vicinamibacteraceae bacterium]
MNALTLPVSRRLAACVLGMFVAAPAAAQDFRGRITGVVADSSGALLPGVTVTAQSPALIQPQVAVTDPGGTYRLIALPPGVYDVTFELGGFQTLKQQGVRVVINTTLTLNARLNVASLTETVTVSSESPIVDTTTTGVGTNFVKELLTEIPNARDVWAAMSQSAAIHVTGFDVGGSHTGTQTGYMTYGMTDQNTTRIEGINTTVDTDANAGYFDFGSFEEFQIGGAGNMADQDTPGASLNVTVKSGGDDFSGTWYSDWEGDRTVSDNVPSTFLTQGERDEDGFFTTEDEGLQRGNPIDRQYDINADVGGPVYRGKAWFYYSYRLNDQYKHVLNFDELARSKLTNPFTVKGTYQLNHNNQLIGYANKREKLQALRDLGPNVPVSAAYAQSSRNYVYKGEWTSILSDRLFLDVIAGTWRNFFPLRPTTETGAFAGPYVPGRLDLSTDARLDGGPNITYQDQQRYKPQFSVSLTYDKSGWIGSHNFKLGTEGRWETRKFFADQPFNHVYYDEVLNEVPSEVELYNTPNEGDNRVHAFAMYLNDNWRIGNRVTLNLGFRLDRYRDFWPNQLVTPE